MKCSLDVYLKLVPLRSLLNRQVNSELNIIFFFFFCLIAGTSKATYLSGMHAQSTSHNVNNLQPKQIDIWTFLNLVTHQTLKQMTTVEGKWYHPMISQVGLWFCAEVFTSMASFLLQASAQYVAVCYEMNYESLAGRRRNTRWWKGKSDRVFSRCKYKRTCTRTHCTPRPICCTASCGRPITIMICVLVNVRVRPQWATETITENSAQSER